MFPLGLALGFKAVWLGVCISDLRLREMGVLGLERCCALILGLIARWAEVAFAAWEVLALGVLEGREWPGGGGI